MLTFTCLVVVSLAGLYCQCYNILVGCHGDFSVEDIIERYMKEEIVASQKLKAPLPPLKAKVQYILVNLDFDEFSIQIAS